MQFRRAVDAAKTQASPLCAVFGLSSEAATRQKTWGLEMIPGLIEYVDDIK